MDTGQIASLLEPFLEQPLDLPALQQISTYIDLLQRWNARINLTAIRREEEIVPRHFGESLFLARHLFPARSNDRGTDKLTDHRPLTTDHCIRVLDIGSGAGFPALPLKIWAPQIQLKMIESNHKKATFLREVARALTLMNVDVITERAEVVAARPDFPRTEIVTLRAVESFEAVLPTAKSLLAPNGTLALLIGSAQASRLGALAGLRWQPPLPVPNSTQRVLSIGILQ